jgi:hypothetical protein
VKYPPAKLSPINNVFIYATKGFWQRNQVYFSENSEE